MQEDSPRPGRSDYLDFDLEIGPGTGRDYPVAVHDPPAGEARECAILAVQSAMKALQCIPDEEEEAAIELLGLVSELVNRSSGIFWGFGAED